MTASSSIDVKAGDSAGGGLVLALLQVIRDEGLPTPAGAVLISPVGLPLHDFLLRMTHADVHFSIHSGGRCPFQSVHCDPYAEITSSNFQRPDSLVSLDPASELRPVMIGSPLVS